MTPQPTATTGVRTGIPVPVILAVVTVFITSGLGLPFKLIPVLLLGAEPGLVPAVDEVSVATITVVVIARSIIEVVAAALLLRRSAAARAVLTAACMASFVVTFLSLTPDMYEIAGAVPPTMISVAVIVLLHLPGVNRWLAPMPRDAHEPRRPLQATLGALTALVWSLPLLVVAIFFVARVDWSYRAAQPWFESLFPFLIGGDIALLLGLEMVALSLPAFVAALACFRRVRFAPALIVLSAAVAIGYLRHAVGTVAPSDPFVATILGVVALAALASVALLHSSSVLAWFSIGSDAPAEDVVAAS
ncbi:hypothetical protein G5C66_13775 [Nocardioides sp. KC13]|uniref:Uncharacterized protein n=1 Tax=Nocardioides turkmenicus TaxID=2711220 RepID=A0A6M1R899_9ACTN|nr:hypothetical protein [Nocardioides sp. KC13]NGN93808.1 hypothetical protein [Nocardioides sp. KC13]